MGSGQEFFELKTFYNFNDNKESEQLDEDNNEEIVNDSTNNCDDLSENWWDEPKFEEIIDKR